MEDFMDFTGFGHLGDFAHISHGSAQFGNGCQ